MKNLMKSIILEILTFICFINVCGFEKRIAQAMNESARHALNELTMGHISLIIFGIFLGAISFCKGETKRECIIIGTMMICILIVIEILVFLDWFIVSINIPFFYKNYEDIVRFSAIFSGVNAYSAFINYAEIKNIKSDI